MIQRIRTKTTGDFYLLEDATGQLFQVDQTLATTAGGHQDRLASVAENWELVEGFSEGSGEASQSHPERVSVITAFHFANEAFSAGTDDGVRVPLTPTELKTIMSAQDIHNAKVRGVDPPATAEGD